MENKTFLFFNNGMEDLRMYQQAEWIIVHCVLPVLCCFGILGNILNLVVLSRKYLTMRMERLEQCAHGHLIALAVSDLLYCVTILPRSAMPAFVSASYVSPWLLYEAYHGAIINTFLLCSSWLTVAMAVSRYIAICYPVQARQHLGITSTRVVIAGIFIMSVVFNLPRYFIKSIQSLKCQEGGYTYFSFHGPLRRLRNAEDIYLWIYFVVGILFPLMVVVYCNVYFLRALKSSKKLRSKHSCTHYTSPSPSPTSTSTILTLTLSVIVILYVLLVTPAEIIAFFKSSATKRFADNRKALAYYSLASAIINALQVLNFAVNFLLYCLINVHFRRVIANVLCHLRSSPPRHLRKVTWGEGSSMVPDTTVTVSL